MFKNLYCAIDKVAQTTVGAIIQETNDAPAIRAFYDALRAEGSLLEQHPADFDMLLIGSIDTNTGTIYAPQNGPTIVATGNGWLEMQKGLTPNG